MHVFGEVSTPSRGSRRPLAAFSLVEVLVVISIAALSTAALSQVFVSASEKGRQTICLSNERRIGLGIIQYAQDNDGTLMPENIGTRVPRTRKWMDLVYPYVKNEDTFTCPDVSSKDRTAHYVYQPKRGSRNYGTYGINGSYYHRTGVPGVTATAPFQASVGTSLSKIVVPASTVLLTEMRTGAPYRGMPWNAAVDWADPTENPGVNMSAKPPTLVPAGNKKKDPLVILRHSGGANVLWGDGHADWMSGADLAATHNIKGVPIAYRWTIEDD